MATEFASKAAQVDQSSDYPKKSGFALSALTSLFFMWGFITCLNDILIPYLKSAFQLSYTQAMLVQFCFFGAYFIVSIPAGNLVGKIGFQKGIVLGLAIAALGCVLFVPAAIIGVYEIFLLALFVLASGITVLQVSANPYVSALGKPETAPSRLTLTQAFNALGTTIAPFFGAYLLFSSGQDITSSGADAVKVPYLILAATLAVLAIVFAVLKLPKLVESKEDLSASSRPLTDHPHLVLGAIGIFLYVGAEVSIGSFLVSFLHQPSIAGLNESQAAKLIAYYWGGAMVGRFIGAAVMQKVAGGKVLAFNAVMSMSLVIFAVSQTGAIAMWAMLAVGLFNSIMFPTIFSLAISGLGKDASRGSGLLCLAIVGGAIIPILQGVLADNIGLQGSFFLPAACYIFITYFGLWGCHKKSSKERMQ
ncbi:sugar MFS transporter [Pseudoalteromonas sp. SMS1]|uniref:sugar MFS transporter n=1 Tax=Pseudoalteromonas sp. SMS1 TaxID=2908894 RepID=UPI001F2A213B|nr:sugar MFS transporter [Pseudoalteromonas sp. SMS1]MCF2859504.1 sugar MFS transporter [Pseudoalteromonas sp. SMS1]